MNAAFDATTTALAFRDLDPEQCPDGMIATGAASLARVGTLEVGVWEHPVGRSTDVEADEVFVVLAGRGRVELPHGAELDLAPGTVGVLQAGTPTTWIITEPLRKVWIAPR